MSVNANPARRQDGFILIVVIWMTALFALVTAGFVRAVQAHLRNTTTQIQSARADIVFAAGRLEARRRCHRVNVFRHQTVVPADDVALGIETGLQHVMRHRPRTCCGDVLFTRQDQFHGFLGDVG